MVFLKILMIYHRYHTVLSHPFITVVRRPWYRCLPTRGIAPSTAESRKGSAGAASATGGDGDTMAFVMANKWDFMGT
jgi:hypothetical protein